MSVPGSIPSMILEFFCKPCVIFDCDAEQKYQINTQLCGRARASCTSFLYGFALTAGPTGLERFASADKRSIYRKAAMEGIRHVCAPLKPSWPGHVLPHSHANRVGEYLGRMLYVNPGGKIQRVASTIVCGMAQLLNTLMAGSAGLFLFLSFHSVYSSRFGGSALKTSATGCLLTSCSFL